jgi:hypothetical protein
MVRIGEWSLPVSPMKEDTCGIFYLKSDPFATLLRGETMNKKSYERSAFLISLP